MDCLTKMSRASFKRINNNYYKDNNIINDTCAWTPNKVFIHFLLVSVETARVLLQSWWARLSTGASREAPVDNECLGKCRQVGGDGRRREILIGRLLGAGLGKSRQV